MSDLKSVLTKIIKRRRLTGGEFSYVFVPTGESVTGKKVIWGMVKADAEAYNKIRGEAGFEDEDEAQFDARALKSIPLVGYEGELTEGVIDMEVEGAEREHFSVAFEVIPFDEFHRKVSVSNFDKKSSPEECESFLRQFENVGSIKRRMMSIKKGKGGSKEVFSGFYDVTFKDNESASNFLTLPEVKFKERLLNAKLSRTVSQEKMLRRMHSTALSHNRRMTECLAIEGEEGKQVFVFGIGLHSDEQIQEYFCGLESEFSNIITARTVYVQQNKSKRFRGYLLGFEDEKSADEFCKKDKKFKEKDLRCLRLSDVVARIQMHRRKANFDDHSGEFNESESDKRIVLLRVNEPDVNKADTKVKEMYEKVVNVHRSAADQGIAEHITIVTFATSDAAKAAMNVEPDSDFVKPINIMGMVEYLEERWKLLEEFKERAEKSNKKYKNIRDNHVSIEGNTVIVTDPTEHPSNEKNKKNKNVTASAEVSLKGKSRGCQTEIMAQGALAKRQKRGSSDWDIYVAVGNLQPKMKNLGKPSDMDVCNYFLHNHKDVADVKFINWTDIVFVKFQDVASAERFLGLSYVMFYGSELTRKDVGTFLQKRNPAQKDEVAKLLLGKKFNDVATGVGVSNTATLNGPNSGPLEVVLSTFPSKNDNVRDLFISELHLSEGDVGQPQWVKADKKFTARMTLRLEENAIGYLVRKWNDLHINVEGETVSAELANGGKGVKREGAQPKPKKPRAKKPRTSFYEDY